MAKRGRPTEFTRDVQDDFCASIAEGNSARSTCNKLGVSLQTICRHNREDEVFREQYARARDDAADSLVDEMREIEDSEKDVQRAKLKCDNRKWVAARMKPKSWGDRQQYEHTGAEGAPLLRPGLDLSNLSPEQLETFRQLMEQAAHGGNAPAPE